MSRVNPLFFFALDVVTHADTVMVVVPAIPTRLGRMLLDSHGGLVLPNPSCNPATGLLQYNGYIHYVQVLSYL